jgi:hypothetical protein
MAFSPDGTVLASGGEAAIRRWETATGGRLTRNFLAKYGSVPAIAGTLRSILRREVGVARIAQIPGVCVMRLDRGLWANMMKLLFVGWKSILPH